jgi:molybdenum cofactor biosynthesis enzyme MoaA
MTPKQGINGIEQKVNWRNFKKACMLAEKKGVTTVLITGKGEPTLYPEQITEFLEKLKDFKFPIIELQTNGIVLEKEFERYEEYLKDWYEKGLDIISISIAHYDSIKNGEIFTSDKEYINLERLIKKLHEIGFSVRLSCVLVKGYIDSIYEIVKLINVAKEWKVDQLTLRQLSRPLFSESKRISQWVKDHSLDQKELSSIKSFFDKNAARLATLEHGAVIYDFNDQNICLTNALTIEPYTENIRQLIFFPNGHLKYDWQFKGATLL